LENIFSTVERMSKVSSNDSAPHASNSPSEQKSYKEKSASQRQYKDPAMQEAQNAAGRVGTPDIEFSANVKARELRFEEVPETEVRFWGQPERNSVSANERKNLPEEVQQGVTYRDVSVRSRIASELVAIEEEPDATNAAKQKAEALGVNLSEVRGSGADGRITLKDVTKAAQG
jgi:pyruvate/2-oxoglutarate dehydrogenase complex dihydrolipoamide acyltransferase (E2) component